MLGLAAGGGVNVLGDTTRTLVSGWLGATGRLTLGVTERLTLGVEFPLGGTTRAWTGGWLDCGTFETRGPK